jgi:hypothetical protein
VNRFEEIISGLTPNIYVHLCHVLIPNGMITAKVNAEKTGLPKGDDQIPNRAPGSMPVSILLVEQETGQSGSPKAISQWAR